MWLVLFAMLAFAPIAWAIYMYGIETKGYTGFRAAAQDVMQQASKGARVLVSSDASGEGMFISEIAMRDQRPNLYVERASNLLVDPKTKQWDGHNVQLRFPDDDALAEHLVKSKLEYIILDDAVPEAKRTEYHDQLRRVVQGSAGVFWPIGEYPVMRENEPYTPPIRVYRILRRVQDVH
jgi:hypothetical protein